MKHLRHLLWAAIIAGLAAGLLSAILIETRLAPLIAEAETYENVAPHEHAADAGATADQTQSHDHDHAGAIEPEGVTRVALTVLSTVLATVGFGLVLGGVAHLTTLPITRKTGWLWGLGGFWAVHFMPGQILPPELPGMVAADLAGRQLIWVLTALATGSGLLGMVKARNLPARAVGAGLAFSPLLFPVLRADGQGAVPPELAAAFASNAMAVNAVTWLVLGTLYALALERGPK